MRDQMRDQMSNQMSNHLRKNVLYIVIIGVAVLLVLAVT